MGWVYRQWSRVIQCSPVVVVPLRLSPHKLWFSSLFQGRPREPSINSVCYSRVSRIGFRDLHSVRAPPLFLLDRVGLRQAPDVERHVRIARRVLLPDGLEMEGGIEVASDAFEVREEIGFDIVSVQLE